jgi:hypothetical protein
MQWRGHACSGERACTVQRSSVRRAHACSGECVHCVRWPLTVVYLGCSPSVPSTPAAGYPASAIPGLPGSVAVSFVYPHEAMALPPMYAKSELLTVALRLKPEIITPLPSSRSKVHLSKVAPDVPWRKTAPARSSAPARARAELERHDTRQQGANRSRLTAANRSHRRSHLAAANRSRQSQPPIAATVAATSQPPIAAANRSRQSWPLIAAAVAAANHSRQSQRTSRERESKQRSRRWRPSIVGCHGFEPRTYAQSPAEGTPCASMYV